MYQKNFYHPSSIIVIYELRNLNWMMKIKRVWTNVISVGINGSDLVFVVGPSPIFLFKPRSKSSQSKIRPYQTCDAPALVVLVRKVEFLKYFVRKILADSRLRFIRSLQACLASKALLNKWKFLKLIPPFSLGQHVF